MGGDLNLKKSWHPHLLRNQERVWQEERKALEERKKIEELKKEREEERQLQELRALQQSIGSSGTAALDRVDFLYNCSGGDVSRTVEGSEAYLLGKRRIDSLLKGDDNEKLRKEPGERAFTIAQSANTVRDTQNKISQDPLLAIKRNEQQALEILLKGTATRTLYGSSGVIKKEQDDSCRSEDSQYHQTRENAERSSRQKLRRPTRLGHSSRSASRRHSKRNRSRSPLEDYKGANRRVYSSNSLNASYNYASKNHKHLESQLHSRRDNKHSPLVNHSQILDSIQSSASHHHHTNVNNNRTTMMRTASKEAQNTSSTKIDAMMSNASIINAERSRRLTHMSAKENADSEREEAKRLCNSRIGSQAQFLSSANKSAARLDVGERLRRERHNMIREGGD